MILPLLTGLGIGIVVGLLGAGGGILSIPALMYLLDQSAYAAAIGSLLGVLLTSAGSLTIHVRAGNVNVKKGLIFGGLSVVGSFIGARVSLLIDDTIIIRTFAIFLLLVAVLFAINTFRSKDAVTGVSNEPMTTGEKFTLVAVATVTGFATGLFGVGGGFMVVPALVLVMNTRMREAVGTSLLIMVISSIVGILGRLPFHSGIDWGLIGLFVGGSIVGGLIGSEYSKKLPPRVLTGTFSVLVAAVGVYTMSQSWF